MLIFWAVLGGFVLDAIFADPAWLPHPVVLMGRCISALEKRLRAALPTTPQGELLGGAVLGAISGLLKSYCNVNEVISGIMLNWITLYLTNMLLTTVKEDTSPYTLVLSTTNPSALLPSLGIGALFDNNQYVGLALPLSLVMALLVWVVLGRTKFGYELKAVGLNKSAARYAGINEKKNIILSMAIAGALAGFGAGLYYLSNVSQWNPLNSTSLPAMGFNGISVALLASSNPIGTIFSALFISHISVGGSFLSTKYYPTEISDLISGIIIYLCAFSMLFRGKIHGLLFKNADKTNVNAEPAPAKTETKKEGK